MIFKLLVYISCLILFAFIFLGFSKFGLQRSYSYYAVKWNEGKNSIPVLNIWSIVTFISAILLIPALIEFGDGSIFQFLGFFTPLYMIGDALTPNFEFNNKEHKLHNLFSVLCLFAAILYIIFVINQGLVLLISVIILLLVALITKTIKSSFLLWIELAMFIGMYASIIMYLI